MQTMGDPELMKRVRLV